MTNHLVQSTLFAGVVALLTLAFRENGARVRHWLWMAASIKFLIPFSLLVGLGSRVQWRSAAPTGFSTESVGWLFGSPEVHVVLGSGSSGLDWGWVGGVVWVVGCAIVSGYWIFRWMKVSAAVRRGRVANPPQAASLPHITTGVTEPGVFGIFRPVLLLPRGIGERLSAEELDAIVAHEMCHVRRRDNLTAAIHMIVEALFWFHPLVWWIGARLVEERERACDEEVLRLGREPEVYAESILKVCRLYLESPVACVSGVTGADLKKRIEAIMTRGVGLELNFARRILLASAGMAAVLGPVTVGIWNAPPLLAQEQPGARPVFEVASVKPSKAEGFGMEFSPSGRFTARGVPFLFLVSTAYSVPFQGPRLTGIDAKTANERYDIEATAEAGAIPAGASKLVREAKMKLMLQTLLEERFKMKVHRETKEMAVYAVIVGKNGPKLKKATIEEKDCPDGPSDKGPGCHNFRGGMGRGLHADAVTIADLVLAVSNWADRPVIDRTGLEGLFAIETDGWSPMVPRGPDANEAETKAMSDPARPTLYMIFDRLGLKMESSKAPLEIFVVEHVEKPSGN